MIDGAKKSLKRFDIATTLTLIQLTTTKTNKSFPTTKQH